MTLPVSTLPQFKFSGRHGLARWLGLRKLSLAHGLPHQARPFTVKDLLFLIRTACQAILTRLLRLGMMLLVCIGAATVWDAKVGDGPMPLMIKPSGDAPGQRLSALSFPLPASSLFALARQNSTAETNSTPNAATYWPALLPSRQLLTAISPPIAAWLEALHREGHIVNAEPAHIHQIYQVSEGIELLAAYRYGENTLYLGQAFWRLSDGDKAAVLAHEYRHSRQNIGKRLSYQLAQLVGLGSLQQASPLEAEALGYEQDARIALGLI